MGSNPTVPTRVADVRSRGCGQKVSHLSWAQGIEQVRFLPSPPDDENDRFEQPAAWWRAVLMQEPCVYCGEPAAGLDHIEPQSRGGRDAADNRAPACRRCDQLKANASLLVFLWAVDRARRTIRRRAVGRARHGHQKLTVQQEIGMLKCSVRGDIKRIQPDVAPIA